MVREHFDVDLGGGEVDEAGIAAAQDLVRRLLAEFDRAARLLGTPYWLAYGTLLGAVRGGDLIAWDVDADVWVRGADLRRLVRELPGVLGEDFDLCAPERTPGYEYLFPRLVLRGVHHVHLRLDLFPLDRAPASALGRRCYARGMRLLDRLHYAKRADVRLRPHLSPRELRTLRVVRWLLLPVPARLLRALFVTVRRWGKGELLVNPCGSYGTREFVQSTWFDSHEPLSVGELSLPGPVAAAEVLHHLYGDYMTPVSAPRQREESALATMAVVAPLRTAGVLPEGDPS